MPGLECGVKGVMGDPGTRRGRLRLSVLGCRRLESAEVIMMYR